MKSAMKMEDRILSVIAFACYLLALMTCSLAIYALVMLSQKAYGNLGQGFYLTASPF
jgi:hypothetical protein